VFSEIGSYETTLISSRKMENDERVVRIRRRIEGVLVATSTVCWSIIFMKAGLKRRRRSRRDLNHYNFKA
jgi:hypothetical protein